MDNTQPMVNPAGDTNQGNRFSLLRILLVNAVPFLGVLFWDWDPYLLLFFYLMETTMFLFVYPVKVMVQRKEIGGGALNLVLGAVSFLLFVTSGFVFLYQSLTMPNAGGADYFALIRPTFVHVLSVAWDTKWALFGVLLAVMLEPMPVLRDKTDTHAMRTLFRMLRRTAFIWVFVMFAGMLAAEYRLPVAAGIIIIIARIFEDVLEHYLVWKQKRRETKDKDPAWLKLTEGVAMFGVIFAFLFGLALLIGWAEEEGYGTNDRLVGISSGMESAEVLDGFDIATFAAAFIEPVDMALDEANMIAVVADRAAGAVFAVSARQDGQEGEMMYRLVGGLLEPHSLAVDRSSETLAVADNDGVTAYKFKNAFFNLRRGRVILPLKVDGKHKLVIAADGAGSLFVAVPNDCDGCGVLRGKVVRVPLTGKRLSEPEETDGGSGREVLDIANHPQTKQAWLLERDSEAGLFVIRPADNATGAISPAPDCKLSTVLVPDPMEITKRVVNKSGACVGRAFAIPIAKPGDFASLAFVPAGWRDDTWTHDLLVAYPVSAADSVADDDKVNTAPEVLRIDLGADGTRIKGADIFLQSGFFRATGEPRRIRAFPGGQAFIVDKTSASLVHIFYENPE